MARIMSYGIKHGPPPQCYNVISARKLPNPYSYPPLQSLDGRDAAVQEYVFQDPSADKVVEDAARFLRMGENIAIGCVGGRHRSVAVVERVRALFDASADIHVIHRDL